MAYCVMEEYAIQNRTITTLNMEINYWISGRLPLTVKQTKMKKRSTVGAIDRKCDAMSSPSSSLSSPVDLRWKTEE